MSVTASEPINVAEMGTVPKPALPSGRRSGIVYLLLGWIFLIAMFGWYAWRMVGIGIDLRQDFWVFWQDNREYNDINNAFQNSNKALRECEAVAAEDRDKLTPEERHRLAQQAASGHPQPTIAQPGPWLFESPLNLHTLRARWALQKTVYSQLYRGWTRNYDHIQRDKADSGDYELDYPPMRLMTMMLWTWRVQAQFPGLDHYPKSSDRMMDPYTHRPMVATSEIAQPVLSFNTCCEGVSAVAMFFLVWVWTDRIPRGRTSARFSRWLHWPWPKEQELIPSMQGLTRWGDPLLLLPVVFLGACILLSPHISWKMYLADNSDLTLIDSRVTSPGWWIFLILRFLSVVCLARFLPRPFRAPACGLVAATLVWINPGAILDGIGWPQWDLWLPPFFLLAALFASINLWEVGGFFLGIGCLFKGQLLFVAPVLILLPLFAGWPGRFMRFIGGMGAGAGLILWPWLVNNSKSHNFVIVCFIAGIVFALISFTRNLLWPILLETLLDGGRAWRKKYNESRGMTFGITALGAAILAFLLLLAVRHATPFSWFRFTVILLFICIVMLPWFLPRGQLPGWLIFVFAAAIWISAFGLDGSFSWWTIGYKYGAERHQVMQLGYNSLSNLTSILQKRYDWDLHDPVTTLHIPFRQAPYEMDLRDALAAVYFGSAILCAAGAAIHFRRRDPRFLVAIVAPWILFPVLLTQMASRYMVLPATIMAALVGVSVGMSLFQLLMTIISCVMLGGQMLANSAGTAPVTLSITHPTHPDMGWATILLAAIFLFNAIAPTRRAARFREVN